MFYKRNKVVNWWSSSKVYPSILRSCAAVVPSCLDLDPSEEPAWSSSTRAFDSVESRRRRLDVPSPGSIPLHPRAGELLGKTDMNFKISRLVALAKLPNAVTAPSVSTQLKQILLWLWWMWGRVNLVRIVCAGWTITHFFIVWTNPIDLNLTLIVYSFFVISNNIFVCISLNAVSYLEVFPILVSTKCLIRY